MWVKGVHSPASVVIPSIVKGSVSEKIMMIELMVDRNSQDHGVASLFAQGS